MFSIVWHLGLEHGSLSDYLREQVHNFVSTNPFSSSSARLVAIRLIRFPEGTTCVSRTPFLKHWCGVDCRLR